MENYKIILDFSYIIVPFNNFVVSLNNDWFFFIFLFLLASYIFGIFYVRYNIYLDLQSEAIQCDILYKFLVTLIFLFMPVLILFVGLIIIFNIFYYILAYGLKKHYDN